MYYGALDTAVQCETMHGVMPASSTIGTCCFQGQCMVYVIGERERSEPNLVVQLARHRYLALSLLPYVLRICLGAVGHTCRIVMYIRITRGDHSPSSARISCPAVARLWLTTRSCTLSTRSSTRVHACCQRHTVNAFSSLPTRSYVDGKRCVVTALTRTHPVGSPKMQCI